MTNNMNKQWIPTVKSMMKKLSDGDGAVCKSTGGKDNKFNGKLPKWVIQMRVKVIYIQRVNVHGMPMAFVKNGKTDIDVLVPCAILE